MLSRGETPYIDTAMLAMLLKTNIYISSGDSIPDRTKNIQPGQCYDFVQPQVGFDGAGYAKLGKFVFLVEMFLHCFKLSISIFLFLFKIKYKFKLVRGWNLREMYNGWENYID